MGLFKNEFKIILFAAIKKIILKWISTNWLSMEITLYKKYKFPYILRYSWAPRVRSKQGTLSRRKLFHNIQK